MLGCEARKELEMGAAGYVSMYDCDKVVEKRKELHSVDIHEDWWYLTLRSL